MNKAENAGNGYVDEAFQRSSDPKSTIKCVEILVRGTYLENNELSAFKHKKAFACNKQHQHFQEIDNEQNLRFFRKYNVRIDIQAEIIII